MNKPKYKENDKVKFNLSYNNKEYTIIGEIYIIDKYGTFEQNEEPSYDIYVDNFIDTNKPCLVKHIRESFIIEKVE